MKSPGTHHLLFCESLPGQDFSYRWRFVLQDLSSGIRLSASDEEGIAHAERADLLAVVRGLEALDGPARVTLITGSRYVSKGLQHSLGFWRENDFHWENFGRRVPIKDHDLWRRVDRALKFHEVDCRPWRLGAGSVETECNADGLTDASRKCSGGRQCATEELSAADRTSVEPTVAEGPTPTRWRQRCSQLGRVAVAAAAPIIQQIV